MSEFVLKTETERRLYVEALLHCLDHQTLTTHEVLQDLQDILTDDNNIQMPARVGTLPRGEAILIAYRQGSRDRADATEALLGLINSAAGCLEAVQV